MCSFFLLPRVLGRRKQIQTVFFSVSFLTPHFYRKPFVAVATRYREGRRSLYSEELTTRVELWLKMLVQRGQQSQE
jgi:hypothetical protein